ncbi:MAG: DNA replication protein DnaC [Candidatus Improbicoccus devescovinae]|nr:MAG: DNA replication protein DnaC [Candidatus Improbicoccus devescovinae]
MTYSLEINKLISQKLLLTRQKNERLTELKKEIFFKQNPRAKIISQNLQKLLFKTAQNILINNKKEVEILKQEHINLNKELTEILIKNNLPTDFFNIKYSCEICADTGISKTTGKICLCAKKMQREEALKIFLNSSMLNSASAKKNTFEEFSLCFYSHTVTCMIRNQELTEFNIMKETYNKCVDYAKNFDLHSENLLLIGKTGLGKTHLSISIAKAVIQRGYEVVYISSPNMISILNQEEFPNKKINKNPENVYKNNNYFNQEKFINCDLLVIDDLGTEFKTSFSACLIYNLINSRILKGVPSIINTNVSLKKIEELYGDRLISRFIGHYRKLNFVGSDIRQQKVKLNNNNPIVY